MLLFYIKVFIYKPSAGEIRELLWLVLGIRTCLFSFISCMACSQWSKKNPFFFRMWFPTVHWKFPINQISFFFSRGLEHHSKVPWYVQIPFSLVSFYQQKCHPAVKQCLEVPKDSMPDCCNSSAAVGHGDMSSSLQTALKNLHQMCLVHTAFFVACFFSARGVPLLRKLF